MTTLITGGTGFIGAEVVRLLLEKGEKQPVVFDKNLSPHHMPDEILAVEEVPRTLNGKKTEVPVKKLFMGVPVEKAVSRDALANPQAIQFFLDYAQQARAAGKVSSFAGRS